MKDQSLLLALDQGTSSSRAVLFNCVGELIANGSAPLEIEYPKDGWVQQNPKDILISQLQAMKNLEEKISPEQLKLVISCGITNQRETTILWRRSNGEPCGPAIVWQDCRTADICKRWKDQGLEEEWRRRTGLLLDPYFSASKIQWLLENESEAQKALAERDICFGTVESWLLWQITEQKHHYSDMSNASRTLLMDLQSRKWIEPYCEVVGLPKDSLPQLVPCQGNFGKIKKNLPFEGVEIQAMLGDQQAATLGQLCLSKGEAKCTYGTGAFLVVNTDKEIYYSNAGLLSTLAWTDANGSPTYCLEGSLFNAGTVIQWLRDNLGIIQNAQDINRLAEEVKDSAGVMLVPAFTGWGTPYWDPYARGLLIGLTRDSKKGHIARAALEGISLSVANLISLAQEALNTTLKELAVDGGAAASNILLQSQANSTGLTIRRPNNIESTSKGVALLAGVQSGLISNLDNLYAHKDKKAELFHTQLDSNSREKWQSKWNDAVKRSLRWNDE